jgi:regulator of extracellular matrix RemA (YlzA/DUF370 family)
MAKPLSFTFSISKVINAPLPFTYAWCTDFREDDTKIAQIAGEKTRISILERNKNRFIMSVKYRSRGRIVSAARIVSLMPPNAWHLDWIGDEENETGDYYLMKFGNRKTRLNAVFKFENKTSNLQTKPETVKNNNAVWDKYVAALEKDYNQGKRVRQETSRRSA